jgi:hypothetical protein
VEPTAWVHKSCLEEYSNHTGGDAEEIAALGKMIDVDDDDAEDFSQFEREEMDSAELRKRVIADLIEIEKRTGDRDKSPTTAIIETCLKTLGALGRKWSDHAKSSEGVRDSSRFVEFLVLPQQSQTRRLAAKPRSGAGRERRGKAHRPELL